MLFTNQDQALQQEARYRDEPNPRYRGNPMIEALPDVPTTAQAYEALVHQPAPRPEDFRTLPANRKVDLLADLQQLFVPTKQHIEALQGIIAVIRECYEYRNPQRADVQEKLYRADRGQRIGLSRLTPSGGGSNGSVIWGITGSGKTSFVDRLTRYIYSLLGDHNYGRGPIFHSLIQGRQCSWPQLPVVRIQCQNTLKGTINALLTQIDEDLGTSRALLSQKSFNREVFISVVKQVLTIHFVGLLIIEDVQKLRDDALTILEYFCDLMEEAGFPVLLVGTYKFRKPLEEDESVSSKLTAKGHYDWAPMSFNPDAEDHDESDWVVFVRAMWALNVFRAEVEMPLELPEWLHFHTLGVRRFAREMLAAAFRRSIHDRTIATVDQPLLDDIASREMLKYQEALDVLRGQLEGQQIDAATAERFEHFMLPHDSLQALKNGFARRASEKARRRDLKNAQASAGGSDEVQHETAAPSPKTSKSSGKAKPRRRRVAVKGKTPEEVWAAVKRAHQPRG